MSKESSKQTVKKLLKLADVEVDGRRAFDIKVNDERAYDSVLRQGSLGLGESYMDGWWDAKQVDQFICRVLSANLRDKAKITPSMAVNFAAGYVMNRQSVKRARRNAAHHYNIGNDLYELMLDKRMIYSCGYWKDAKTLDEAQTAKLDLICRKLHLKKGMKLLDIGCGWGGFAEYAAKEYGVEVTGISPAAEQVKLAKKRTKGLKVQILQKDYRYITGSFDRIVSIGMLEHVGPKNYLTFFNKCYKLLKDDGLMLHHTIGNNRSVRGGEPWIDKYIFPGGVLPSIAQIAGAIEKKFIVEDLHNFGPYYDRTLMAWYDNFKNNYSKISDRYDERFYRMWTYYLLCCAGAFRSRDIQLWQIVMRKPEMSGVYEAVR